MFEGLLDGDRVGLDVHTVQGDGSTVAFWFYSVSFYVPETLWGRSEDRRVWASATPPGGTVAFDPEVLLEVLP